MLYFILKMSQKCDSYNHEMGPNDTVLITELLPSRSQRASRDLRSVREHLSNPEGLQEAVRAALPVPVYLSDSIFGLNMFYFESLCRVMDGICFSLCSRVHHPENLFSKRVM